MADFSVIIHERVANWSRQLRPRFQGWPIRWSETRSERDLVQTVARSNWPILIVELDRRHLQGLRELHEALQMAPNTLSLVLEPGNRPGVASIAREIGVTLVLTGVVVPPEVERLLQRWLPIATGRAAAEGWSATIEPESDIWDQPDFLTKDSV